MIARLIRAIALAVVPAEKPPGLTFYNQIIDIFSARSFYLLEAQAQSQWTAEWRDKYNGETFACPDKTDSAVEALIKSVGDPYASYHRCDWRPAGAAAAAKLPLVSSRDLGDGITYLKLPHFAYKTNVANDVGAALELHKPVRGLVLDLRGNGGGDMGMATWCAGYFLRSGNIYTKVLRDQSGLGRNHWHYELDAEGLQFRACGREGQALSSQRWHRPQQLVGPNVRVAVLINGRTASAAELLAGALRRNNRACLVGKRTKGKGRGQQDIVFSRVNRSLFFTYSAFIPGGTDDYHGIGLPPDIEVDITKGSGTDEQLAAALRYLTN